MRRMKKRRPTASDRDIADYVRSLPVGSSLLVEDNAVFAGFGLARIKHEGSMEISLDDRTIRITRGRTCV